MLRKDQRKLEKQQLEEKKQVQISKILTQVVSLHKEIKQLIAQPEPTNKFMFYNEIFSNFFQKFQTTLKRTEDIDLIGAFKNIYDLIKEEKFIQTHYLLSLIIIQSFIKIADNIGAFEKANILNMSIKLLLAEKLDDLSFNQTFKNLILALSFLNQGLPIWRKNKDLVPELFLTVNNILLFVQDFIEQAEGIEDSKNINCEEYFGKLYENIVLSNISEEECILYNVQDSEAQGFYCILLKFLKHLFKLTILESNFDILYAPIIKKLNNLCPYLDKTAQKETQELVKKMEEHSAGFELKSRLEILVDKPLIKIKQLDPRIIDYREKKVNHMKERQKVQKKIKKEQRRTVKEVKDDQAAVWDQKKQQENHKNAVAKKSMKDFNFFLEEQQKEIKKMKSTQISRERHKKHNTKLAGNKTETALNSGKGDKKQQPERLDKIYL